MTIELVELQLAEAKAEIALLNARLAELKPTEYDLPIVQHIRATQYRFEAEEQWKSAKQAYEDVSAAAQRDHQIPSAVHPKFLRDTEKIAQLSKNYGTLKTAAKKAELEYLFTRLGLSDESDILKGQK